MADACMAGAEAKLGGRDSLIRPPLGSMMPELPQATGLTDQERMANLIRQCMAPLPTVAITPRRLMFLTNLVPAALYPGTLPACTAVMYAITDTAVLPEGSYKVERRGPKSLQHSLSIALWEQQQGR